MKAGVIGQDGRTTAIKERLQNSSLIEEVISLSNWKDSLNPEDEVMANARKHRPDFIVVGPEEPLAAGIVDRLQNELQIPCVGPTKSLARLESSKAFTRNLVAKYKIPGNPKYAVFRKPDGIASFLKELGDYVIKPDGLTGGKGVKISDAHLFSIEQALHYCNEILDSDSPVVIEEKLEGEEFSLQSFCDGVNVRDMVLVQDHKRAYEGDSGPNTGGMGSYSCADHSLPFLRPEDVKQASAINKFVADALLEETGEKYKGILYGGFMVTRDGVRLLEYNARFGDPETLNVLSILKTDFGKVCKAIIDESLNELEISSERLATVCKYVVPEGYPDRPERNKAVDLSRVPEDSDKLKRYYAAVREENGQFYLTGSRAIAFVGIGKDLEEAQGIAEEAATSVKGPVRHRKDIGTRELIEQRVAHMNEIYSASGQPLLTTR